MQLIFYNNSSHPKKLNKTLTELGRTTYFKPTYENGTDQPTYLLDYSMPAGANYLYDDFTDRYYFITDIGHNIGKTLTLTCQIDPMESFKYKLTGTFYFTRGAESINEMTDQYYPIGSLIPVHHADIQGWDNNLTNSANGRQFVLRAAVGKAKTPRLIPLTYDQLVHHQNCVYKVVSTDDVNGFYFLFQYKAEPPQGPSLNKNDLFSLGGSIYKITDITQIYATDPADGVIYSFDFEYYDEETQN